MNADAPTPRVGFAQLKSFIGKQVLFVGKIESLEHGLVHMAAPDGSKVQVRAGGMAPYDTPFAEILGTVVDPGTIREDSHTNLGDNFGARAAAAAGVVTQQQQQRRQGHAARGLLCNVSSVLQHCSNVHSSRLDSARARPCAVHARCALRAVLRFCRPQPVQRVPQAV